MTDFDPARTVVIAWSLLAVLSPTAAQAQAVPKIGRCPTGYHASGGACLPNSGSAPRPALHKVGPCPTGYHTSGDYCLGSPGAKHAIPTTRACPSGYYVSGAYCLSDN